MYCTSHGFCKYTCLPFLYFDFLKVCKALCQRNWCLLNFHPELKQEKEEAAATEKPASVPNVYIVLVSLMAVKSFVTWEAGLFPCTFPVVASGALSERLNFNSLLCDYFMFSLLPDTQVCYP